MNYETELIVFNNEKSQIQEAAGQILWIEFKIRYLSEISKDICEDYWQCELQRLINVIFDKFDCQLGKEDKELLKLYRKVRNKVLHSSFVEAMELLGLDAGGRVNKGTKKVPLKYHELGESIKVFNRNGGIAGVRKLTSSLESVLDSLIRSI